MQINVLTLFEGLLNHFEVFYNDASSYLHFGVFS